MKKIIPYIAFFCLTGFTATNGLQVIAGGCSRQMNNKTEIKCSEDDTKCQEGKAKKFETTETVNL